MWKNNLESSPNQQVVSFQGSKACGDTLKYTFNERGSDNFSAKGYRKISMTITVK
ncbi:MAG TPA: hypothetical protein VGK06_13005 [Methanosarcina sp.]